jgi:hypothetical protein
MSEITPGRTPAPPPVLSREDRAHLVHAYQAQAARRPDLLAANLGVLNAETMLMAHVLGDRARACLAAGSGTPADAMESARAADMYLKFVRQIERVAQLERRAGPPAGDPPTGVRS